MSNPYQPPNLPAAALPQSTACFEVGDRERHKVDVFLSLWGPEAYTVDGVEVLRLTSYGWRGTRRFSVGVAECHEVEIRLDFLPNWRAMFSPDEWIGQAYVDGKLVHGDLLPRYREIVWKQMRIVTVLLIVCGLAMFVMLVMLLGFAIATAFKW